MNKAPGTKKSKPEPKFSRENLRDFLIIGCLVALPLLLVLGTSAWTQLQQWRTIAGLLKENPEIIVVTDDGIIWILLILLPVIFIWLLAKLSPTTPIPQSARKEDSPLVRKIKDGFAIVAMLAVMFTLNKIIPGTTLNLLSREHYANCLSWKSSLSMRAPTNIAFARTEQACTEFIEKHNEKSTKKP